MLELLPSPFLSLAPESWDQRVLQGLHYWSPLAYSSSFRTQIWTSFYYSLHTDIDPHMLMIPVCLMFGNLSGLGCDIFNWGEENPAFHKTRWNCIHSSCNWKGHSYRGLARSPKRQDFKCSINCRSYRWQTKAFV